MSSHASCTLHFLLQILKQLTSWLDHLLHTTRGTKCKWLWRVVGRRKCTRWSCVVSGKVRGQWARGLKERGVVLGSRLLRCSHASRGAVARAGAQLPSLTRPPCAPRSPRACGAGRCRYCTPDVLLTVSCYVCWNCTFSTGQFIIRLRIMAHFSCCLLLLLVLIAHFIIEVATKIYIFNT